MSHEHPHDHEHGPGCGCGHDPAQPPTPPAPPVQPPEPPTPLDPGAQALAEALRSSFAIVKVAMVILVGAFLFSGFFTVGPQERAIKLRFGRPVGTGDKILLGPGAHWAWPYPIDDVIKVPITEIQKSSSTVGWFAVTPEQEFNNQEPYAGPTLNLAADGYVLTGDQNIIHTRATMNYRIEDPRQFVFALTSATNAVQSALNNALVAAAARFTVDDILTREVAAFKEAVKRRVTTLLEQQKLGVVAEQVEVESRPPRQLKAEFAKVTDAVQKRDKVIIEARSFENKVLSQASAEATNRLNTAESERVRFVERVRADADGFNKLLPRYRENPELFVQLRLNEAIGRLMTNVQDKIYLPETERELRLLLNREPPKARTNAGPNL